MHGLFFTAAWKFVVLSGLCEFTQICVSLHKFAQICAHFWYTLFKVSYWSSIAWLLRQLPCPPFKVPYWSSIAWLFRQLPCPALNDTCEWISEWLTTVGIDLLFAAKNVTSWKAYFYSNWPKKKLAKICKNLRHKIG